MKKIVKPHKARKPPVSTDIPCAFGVTLPNVTVTPQKYASSFDGSLDNVLNTLNAMTGGIMNRFSPTQNARALYDTYQLLNGNLSKDDWWNGLVYGNNGVVSDKYAQENPIMSFLINFIGDVGGNFAGRTIKTLSKVPFYRKTYTGVPSKVDTSSGINMRDRFLNNSDFDIWTSDNPGYAATFANEFFDASDKNPDGIFTIFGNSKNTARPPKLPKNTEVAWNVLPYEFKENKLKFKPTAKKINSGKYGIDYADGNNGKVDKTFYATDNLLRRWMTSPYKSPILENPTSTDDLVRQAFEKNYDAIEFNNVFDGGFTDPKTFNITDAPINEIIYSPGADVIKMKGIKNKTDLSKYLIKNTDYSPVLYNSTLNTVQNATRYRKGKDSGIHIKKKNRGKFTALKKRTGKSASWFKEHGTPAQKKMAVFALNARKWKH